MPVYTHTNPFIIDEIKVYNSRFVSPFSLTESPSSQTTLKITDSFCIQNKTSANILININTEAPANDSKDGIQLKPLEEMCFPMHLSGFHIKIIQDLRYETEGKVCIYNPSINQVSNSESQPSEHIDFEGKQAMNTVFGEATVAERNDRINISFQYNISSIDVNTTQTGTGLVQHISNARASVETGTGVGFARMQSRESIRYVAGKEMVCNFTADFTEGEAGTYQYAGIFDEENGFAVGYNGTQYGMLFRSAGVDEFVPESEFNAKPHWFVFDPNFYSIYKISYGWLGVAPAILSVYGGHKNGWIPLHVIDKTQGSEVPHLSNPVLPITIEVARTTGTGSNLTVHTSSWRGGIVGKSAAGTNSDRTFTRTIMEKVILANTLNPIITIRNKPTFQGVVNHVRARYGTVSISTEGNKSVVISVYRNGTLVGGTFVDYDTENSVCQYNTTATSYTPSGSAIGGTLLGKSDKVRINLFENDVVIPIYPNETVTLCAESSSGSEISLFIRHIEEF